MTTLPVGTPIYHFGRIWIIASKPFIVPGFTDAVQKIVRRSPRDTWQWSTMHSAPLPDEHPHSWQPFAQYLTQKMAAAVHGVWGGHAFYAEIRRSAKQRRRQKVWRRLLLKFFKEAHAIEQRNYARLRSSISAVSP